MVRRWDELHQVSTACANPQLKVECEWRLSMQEQLAATIKSASLADTSDNGIVMCYSLALSDRSHELYSQTKIVTQRLQHEWSLVPSTAIDARIAMLQKTSQFVEVNEGAKVVQEIKHLFAGNTQPVCSLLLYFQYKSDLDIHNAFHLISFIFCINSARLFMHSGRFARLERSCCIERCMQWHTVCLEISAQVHTFM